MKLVEMIPGYNTSQETIDFAVDMAKKTAEDTDSRDGSPWFCGKPNAGSYDQRGGIRISGRAGESGRYRPGDETGAESSDGTSRFGGSGGSGYLPFDHGRYYMKSSESRNTEPALFSENGQSRKTGTEDRRRIL